jgi:hypothetical protein
MISIDKSQMHSVLEVYYIILIIKNDVVEPEDHNFKKTHFKISKNKTILINVI